MKNTDLLSSQDQPVNLVNMAQLVLDYEADPDYINSDIQRGIMTDMLKLLKSDPPQLVHTLPTLPVAKVLCLAFMREIYGGIQEAEILATATYFSLSRAMLENPRDKSLHWERYCTVKKSQRILGRLLSDTVRKPSNFSDGFSEFTNQKSLIPQMLLTDLLDVEELIEDREILSTQLRGVLEQLEEHQKQKCKLYQHINWGLENHELVTDYLYGLLQLPQAWLFILREDSTKNDIHK